MILGTNNKTDNCDNTQQICKGCEKSLSSSLFITNGKFYRTCSNCRLQSKMNYYRKQQLKSPNADIIDRMPIEFDDLNDYISGIFDEFDNTISNEERSENKENEANLAFRFFCTVKITTLKGDSKERANEIIKVISDVDEYTWM
jgi:hypothetical protein